MANYEFNLPPKKDQDKILKLLVSTFELEKLKSCNINRLNTYLKSFEKKYLNCGYDSNLSSLPKGWKRLRIKDFSKVQAGSTPLRSNNSYFENGSVFWLKTLDLNNGCIVGTEEKITKLALAETSCKVKPPETVLVAMYGGFKQIGRTGILKVPAATNQAVSAIEVDKNIINPKFLLYVLNSRIEYWKKVAISSRKDPNITKDDVECFPVSLPPLEEQNTLVSKISIILDTLSDAEEDKTLLHNFSRSLTAEVF